MFKIHWNLFNNPNDLWCQVLINKYDRKQNLVENMTSEPNDSPLWKTLTKVWEKFLKSILWKFGDGRRVNFLLDHCNPTKKPFFSQLAQRDTIIDITRMVKDMVNDEEKWNLEFLQEWFIVELVNFIIVILHSLPDDGVDRIGWGIIETSTFMWGIPINTLFF